MTTTMPDISQDDNSRDEATYGSDHLRFASIASSPGAARP